MDPNEQGDPKQPSFFKLMSNVRDHCTQPMRLKLLLFTVVSYSNGKGEAFPSNATLARTMSVSIPTIKRMLRTLIDSGEIEVLANGKGRDQRRVLRLSKYVETLNGSGSLGDVIRLNGSHLPDAWSTNNQREQPIHSSSLRSEEHGHSAGATRPLSPIVNFELLSRDEKKIVQHFNLTLPKLGWLKVTKVTRQLQDALIGRDLDDIHSLIDDVANDPPDVWPKRTLVRLLWDSY